MLLERINQAERQAGGYAVPIYGGAGRKRTPELIGTGTLIQLSGRKLLLTAAHVVTCFDDQHLYLPDEENLRPFDCQIKRFGQAGAAPFEDAIDLAVIDLDEDQQRRLSRYRFVQIPEIEWANTADREGVYTFSGYPASRNKAKFKGDKVTPFPAMITSMSIEPEKYKDHGRPLETHLIVEFSKTGVLSDGTVAASMSPKGLSGGPVWRLGSVAGVMNGTAMPLLAGMAIENKAGVLVAVRSWVILQIIRSTFPDLQNVIRRVPRFRMDGSSPLKRQLTLTRP